MKLLLESIFGRPATRAIKGGLKSNFLSKNDLKNEIYNTATVPHLFDRQKIICLLRSLYESPAAKEAAIVKENNLSQSNSNVETFVKTFHMESDRTASLARYLDSDFSERVIATADKFSAGKKNLSICEIGAGNGFLALSLIKAGYTNIDIVEPSAEFITGTGYAKTLKEFEKVTVYNDVDKWYGSNKRYDLFITNACIHHFSNPLYVLMQVRMKAHLNTIWLAFSEYFAFDCADTISQLLNHRHATLYGLYEYPYSPTLYREMFKNSGFNAIEISPLVIPYGSFKGNSRSNTVTRFLCSLLCNLKISWPIYGILKYFVTRFCSRRIRMLDPALMVYKAAPIYWNKVTLQRNSLGL